MAQPARTFRIFVSSTFHDLKEERNALQEQIFPRLRELCLQHGARFQAIDLRWGVSEQASLDQQAMNICLGEINRCQRTTPRPNFIVLLGDRYGWRPLPAEIPADEFEEIQLRVSDDSDKALLTTWYKRDDNAVPAEYCLQARTGEFEDYDTWEKQVERPLHEILVQATKDMVLSDEQRIKYVASATHQEIAHGALQVEDARDHVFCFFRKIKDLPQDGRAEGFLDLDEGANPDGEARQQLDDLKTELSDLLEANVQQYNPEWTEEGVSTKHIGTLPEKLEDCLNLTDDGTAPSTLCVDVWRSLSRLILEEVGGFILEEVGPPEETDPLEMEIVEHHEFGIDRARFFVGRDDILETVRDYMKGGDPHPLAVWGESGSGKSALMAIAVQQAIEIHPDEEVVFRFVGATPESSDGRALLESLCRQISRRYGADDSTVPADYRELVQELPQRLDLATPEKPLIVLLDALDQLSDADNARNLAWLPGQLPEHVRLVVSTLPGECRSALEGKLPTENLIELQPMPPEQGRELLDLWLEDADRTLQAHQREEVLGKFNEEGNGLPLYLKLAFEEARRWNSYTDPQETTLGPDVPGVIRDLFARLSTEGNHGEMLVSRSLGYLAAAKNGLTEDELLDVLARDVELYTWFLESLYHTPPDLLKCVQEHLEHTSASRPDEERLRPIDEQAAEEWLKGLRTDRARLLEFVSAVLTKDDGLRLPVVLWSRLYFDLEPYLTQRSGDGTALLSFYHGQLAEVTEEQYLSGEEKPKRHQTLARYFEVQPLYIKKDDQETPNLRKLSELPYQQTHGELWDGIEETLCDLYFIEAKSAAGMTYDLIGDYNAAFDALPEAQDKKQEELKNEQRTKRFTEDMITYARAWSDVRERHAMDPEHTPMPKPEQIPLPEIIPSVEPWSDDEIREDAERITNNPTRLDRMRTFSQFVNSESHTLVKFASVPGFCLQQAYNSACSGPVASAAEAIVNAEADDVLLLQPPVQRPDHNPHPALLRTLKGDTRWVYSVSITPDGERAVSGCGDGTLRVWDLVSGECVRTLEGDTDEVRSVSITPDGRKAVSGSLEGPLRVWDLESGECLGTLQGHTGCVVSVSVTPDGRRAVSGSWDETLRVWDLESGECLRTLEGHTGLLDSVGITPDGRRAVSGSWDETLRVWDLESGECLRTIEDHSALGGCVSFTPDGRRALSGSYETLRVWDPESGECLRTLESHTDWVPTVSITPAGTIAISGSRDKTLRVWDLETGESLRTLEGHTDWLESVSLTPDGRTAVSGSRDETLRVWDLERGQCLRTLERPTDEVTCVSVTLDGKTAVSGGRHESLRVWDLESGECLRTLEGHTGWVTSVSVTSDGRRAVSGGDNTLRVWDLESGECLRTLRGHRSGVKSASLSPDGTRAVSGSGDGTLRVWDLDSGAWLATLEGHTDEVGSVAITLDRKRAVSGSHDHTLRVWDLESGACRRTLEGHTHWVTSVSVTPDGKRAVSGGDNTVRVWDLESGECLRTLEGYSGLDGCVSLTPDGRRALSGSHETLHVWDLESGECLASLAGHTYGVTTVSVTPDGKRAVSGSWDEALRVWDLESRHSVAIYDARSKVNSVSQIGTTAHFACGTYAGEVVLLAARNLSMHPPIVTAIRMSSDGDRRMDSYCEDNVEALCQWCGQRFLVATGILDVIGHITREANLSPVQSPCLELPTEAWDDPRLLSECLLCHKSVRFNPFIVDSREESASDKAFVDVDDLLNRGARLLASGRVAESLECFNQALQLRPDDLNLLSYRAAALLTLGRYEDVLEGVDDILERGLASGEDLGYLLGGKAKALTGLQRYEEALVWYRKALEIVPEQGDILFMQGFALYQLREFEKALTSFGKAREFEDDARTSLHVGYCLLMLNRYSDAADEFSSLISQGSPEPQAFYGLGFAKHALGEDREARVYLERFIEIAGPEHEHLLPDAKGILERL